MAINNSLSKKQQPNKHVSNFCTDDSIIPYRIAHL